MADLATEVITNQLSRLLIEEYAVLGSGHVRHVEWIERELRSMQGLLEQVEQITYSQNAQQLNDLADKLKETALDAKNMIEKFVIKSVKRKRWGVLYWNDKFDVGIELVQIRKRMTDISKKIINYSNTSVFSISVENPGEEVVAPAVEKLDHILNPQYVTT